MKLNTENFQRLAFTRATVMIAIVMIRIACFLLTLLENVTKSGFKCCCTFHSESRKSWKNYLRSTFSLTYFCFDGFRHLLVF